jgi:hypothetical protein
MEKRLPFCQSDYLRFGHLLQWFDRFTVAGKRSAVRSSEESKEGYLDALLGIGVADPQLD